MTENGDRVRDTFFDAVDESFGAIFSAFEATLERGHRASGVLFEEARKGEKELTGIARRWVASPVSAYENVEAMVDAQVRGQHRALELARDALNGARAQGGDMQDAASRVIRANRAAAEAAIEAARARLTRTRAPGRLRHLQIARPRAGRSSEIEEGSRGASSEAS